MSTQPSSPQVFTYRQLGLNNDPQRGQGTANFLSGAAAVAQSIYTRLLLFEGEWWESLLEGTPLWQQILGTGGGGSASSIEAQTSLLIQNRILGTSYVTAITSLAVSFNSPGLAFSLSAEVTTAFGPVSVIYPSPLPQGIP